MSIHTDSTDTTSNHTYVDSSPPFKRWDHSYGPSVLIEHSQDVRNTFAVTIRLARFHVTAYVSKRDLEWIKEDIERLLK